MSKIDIAALNREVKRIIDKVAKMPRHDCVGSCGGKQPHQLLGDDLVCWCCGSY